MEDLHPVFEVGKQKMQHLVFAVVKQFGVPLRMIAALEKKKKLKVIKMHNMYLKVQWRIKNLQVGKL